MSRDFTFRNFLSDLGLRVAAAGIVVGIFVGLGYAKRLDIPGLSGLLGTEVGFFTTAFLLIGVVAVGWIQVQR